MSAFPASPVATDRDASSTGRGHLGIALALALVTYTGVSKQLEVRSRKKNEKKRKGKNPKLSMTVREGVIIVSRAPRAMASFRRGQSALLRAITSSVDQRIEILRGTTGLVGDGHSGSL